VKLLTLFALVFVAAAWIGRETFASSQGGGAGAAAQKKVVTTASGLRYIDETIGGGAIAQKGQRVTVHYTGYLQNGQKFDSSVDRKEPFDFALGAGMVIRGWDEGVAGMRVGGKRKLIIPPALGYGARGAGGVIPPNAELTFDVELLRVQ
jgi:FKBP-type peptidyl-prolyl cis-trans isomerase